MLQWISFTLMSFKASSSSSLSVSNACLAFNPLLIHCFIFFSCLPMSLLVVVWWTCRHVMQYRDDIRGTHNTDMP